MMIWLRLSGNKFTCSTCLIGRCVRILQLQLTCIVIGVYARRRQTTIERSTSVLNVAGCGMWLLMWLNV